MLCVTIWRLAGGYHAYPVFTHEAKMLSGQRIAVWFSCGAASAIAAKLTLDLYGAANSVRILNNPVKEEGEDNRRFCRDVGTWLGVEVEEVKHRLFPNASAEEVWDKQKGMVFPHGAPCTRYLKKFARQDWEQNNPVDWHVFGFGAEERARHDAFVLTERSNVHSGADRRRPDAPGLL